MSTPMTKIREEFEKKFAGETVYTDYPVEIIADWFINRFQQELSSLEGEIGSMISEGEAMEDLGYNKAILDMIGIIRQHKER